MSVRINAVRFQILIWNLGEWKIINSFYRCEECISAEVKSNVRFKALIKISKNI